MTTMSASKHEPLALRNRILEHPRLYIGGGIGIIHWNIRMLRAGWQYVVRFSGILTLVEVSSGAQGPGDDEWVINEVNNNRTIENARQSAMWEPLMQWVEEVADDRI